MGDSLVFATVRHDQLDDVVRIFVEQFPKRVHRLFADHTNARCFYRDFFRLMWRVHGESFFSVNEIGRLIGFLLLTMPGRNVVPGLLRQWFWAGCLAHAVSGHYGFAAPFLRQVFGGVLTRSGFGGSGALAKLPCIYVVAVDSRDTGRGLGTELIRLARSYCDGRFPAMWLQVERENQGAIRLYERFGFRTICSHKLRCVMVWKFDEGEVCGSEEVLERG